MEIRRFAAGEAIFSIGDLSDYACLIRSGQVNVAGNILGYGAVFGEIEAVSGSARSESAHAVTEVELEILTGDALRAAFESMPHETQRLVKAIEARSRQLVVRNIEENTDVDLSGIDEMGILQPLIADDSINDILVNGAGSVYIERQGRLELTDIKFSNNNEVTNLADKIVRRIGRRIDPHRPMVDARLMDGSRVNVIAPPLSVDGTSISIRKFARRALTIDDMAAAGNVSPALGEFLKIMGKTRMNLLISGGTGSGKTTLLNAVSQYINPSERVVTVEDAAELRLQQLHVVRLETKPLSTRGRSEDEVTARDLVRNALRMRPDRIIVGEVRGTEAFDMMQAMNTGHEGSMSTIHANHPRDALARLENMVSMTNLQLSTRAIRSQIASAIQMVVQISRMRDGVRRITYVSEIVGIEGDVITMQDIFVFKQLGDSHDGKLNGEFRWTGVMPRCVRRIAYYGEYENLSRIFGVKLPKL